jgi:pyruvate formate lyase activating enzyme
MTSIDFPGRLAAVLYCQGCPWRCAYCHNPELRERRQKSGLQWSQVLAFLRRRQGLLDAVVFSGGEPTLQSGLIDAIQEVKALGFEVGLHTAGPYPQRLGKLLPWLDWVGMDVKAPFHCYQKVIGVSGSSVRVRQSISQVLQSGVAHEFRTTVDLNLLSEKDILSLAHTLNDLGVSHYVLQECRYGTDRHLGRSFSDDLVSNLAALFEVFRLRTH